MKDIKTLLIVLLVSVIGAMLTKSYFVYHEITPETDEYMVSTLNIFWKTLLGYSFLLFIGLIGVITGFKKGDL